MPEGKVPMNIIIRAYDHTDAEAARLVWNREVQEASSLSQEEPLSPDQAALFFSMQTHTGVAVDADTGRLMGAYVLRPFTTGRCGHVAVASYAYVDPTTDGELVRRLVVDSMEQAILLGFRVLRTDAVASNVRVLQLYDDMGLRRVGVLPGGYRKPDGTYDDLVLYWHELS